MELMIGVQDFMENANNDRFIFQIFTDKMFLELKQEMHGRGIRTDEAFDKFWEVDYRTRYAVQEFLKDKSIGDKRLASMPDRITNTINLKDGTKCMRPTAINAYDGDPLDSIEDWWETWKRFIFHKQVEIFSGDQRKSRAQLVCSLIGPILRTKYPAITPEEQAISVPLQLLCLAILDCIFIHILNTVAPGWERTRRQLCDALITGKAARICAIITKSYHDFDVIFLQEAAAIFVRQVTDCPDLQSRFRLLAPRALDGKRDQNSLILLSRRRFGDAPVADVTDRIAATLGGPWLAAGDLLAAAVQSADGAGWLLVSFHGDSNGLSTQPVVQAVRDYARAALPGHALLLGLDANTQSRAPDAYHLGLPGFGRFLSAQGLVSAWGPAPAPGLWTTCNARTFLQTQLNKATPMRDRAAESRQNLKDWIVACASQARLGGTNLTSFNAGQVLEVNGNRVWIVGGGDGGGCVVREGGFEAW
jgi:hypothetical protein